MRNARLSFLVVLLWGCAPKNETLVRSHLTAAGKTCGEVVPAAAFADTTFAVVEDVPHSFRPAAGGMRALRYPPRLREQGVEGQVIATYIVDTTGRVIPGTAVINLETDVAFGDAVCAFLAQVRFTPFIANGRRYSVRILENTFKFSLMR